MLDKWLVVGGAHCVLTAVALKLLGLVAPCCVSAAAHLLLVLCTAGLTFELAKRWYLDERLQPENRAVFITGCDTGFGHHTAKLLDSVGYPVFAGCLDGNSNGAKELRRSCSKRLQTLQIDVTKDDSVKSAFDFIRDNLGTSELWAIVNNAGILRGTEVELTDMADFRDTMEVNAFGPVRVTRAFLPLLRQSRGRVVNITSLGGRLPLPYCTPYIMSKYAAVGFTECLAVEMAAWGIRVISIEPEFFNTNLAKPEAVKKHIDELFDKVDPDVRDDYGDKYIKNFKFYSDLVTGILSDDIHSVVDSIDRAVSLKYPNSVYTPCRNIFYTTVFFLLKNLPRTVCHSLIRLALAVTGFPRPREAENYL